MAEPLLPPIAVRDLHAGDAIQISGSGHDGVAIVKDVRRHADGSVTLEMSVPVKREVLPPVDEKGSPVDDDV